MTVAAIYNNIGIEALALQLVLQKMEEKTISKALLILPFITHKALLDYLANGKVKIQGMDKLLIEKTSYFANFNKRYYDSLCSSLNAIQFLHEIDLIQVTGKDIRIKTDIGFDRTMGSRAQKIFKASPNIAKLLNEGVEKLYLNLRIEL